MTLGELFLEAMSSGVITKGEMTWVTDHQNNFSLHHIIIEIPMLGRIQMRQQTQVQA